VQVRQNRAHEDYDFDQQGAPPSDAAVMLWSRLIDTIPSRMISHFFRAAFTS